MHKKDRIEVYTGTSETPATIIKCNEGGSDTENPIENSSVEQIAKIYTGEISNWKEVGDDDQAIVLINRIFAIAISRNEELYEY